MPFSQADLDALDQTFGFATVQPESSSLVGRSLQHVGNLPANIINAIGGDVQALMPENVRHTTQVGVPFDIGPATTTGEKVVDFIGGTLAPELGEFALTYGLGGPATKAAKLTGATREAVRQGGALAFSAADQGPGAMVVSGLTGAAGGALEKFGRVARIMPNVGVSSADFLLQMGIGGLDPGEAATRATIDFLANMVPGKLRIDLPKADIATMQTPPSELPHAVFGQLRADIDETLTTGPRQEPPDWDFLTNPTPAPGLEQAHRSVWDIGLAAEPRAGITTEDPLSYYLRLAEGETNQRMAIEEGLRNDQIGYNAHQGYLEAANKEILEQITGRPQSGTRRAFAAARTILEGDEREMLEMERLHREYNPRSREDYLADVQNPQQAALKKGWKDFVAARPRELPPEWEIMRHTDEADPTNESWLEFMFDGLHRQINDAYHQMPTDPRLSRDFDIINDLKRRAVTKYAEDEGWRYDGIEPNSGAVMVTDLKAGSPSFGTTISLPLNRKMEEIAQSIALKRAEFDVPRIDTPEKLDDLLTQLGFTTPRSEGGIPVFKNTEEAIAFGSKASPAEIAMLQNELRRVTGELVQKTTKGTFGQAGDEALVFQRQFINEALQHQSKGEQIAKAKAVSEIKPLPTKGKVVTEKAKSLTPGSAQYYKKHGAEKTVKAEIAAVVDGSKPLGYVGTAKDVKKVDKQNLVREGGFYARTPEELEVGLKKIRAARALSGDEYHQAMGEAFGFSKKEIQQFIKQQRPKSMKLGGQGVSGQIGAEAVTVTGGAVAGGLTGYAVSDGDPAAALAGAMAGAGIAFGGAKLMEALARGNPKVVKPTAAATAKATVDDIKRVFEEPLRDTGGRDVRGMGGSLDKLVRFGEVWANLNLPAEIRVAMTRARGAANEYVQLMNDALQKMASAVRPTPAVIDAASRYVDGKMIPEADVIRFIENEGGMTQEAWQSIRRVDRPDMVVWHVGSGDAEKTFRISRASRNRLFKMEEDAFRQTLPEEHLQYGNLVVVGRNSVNALQQLLAEGLPNGAIKDMIDNTVGQYLTRAYRIFHDPKYRPSEELIDKAAKELGVFMHSNLIKAAEGMKKGMSEAQYHTLMTRLNAAKDARSIERLERLRTFEPVELGSKRYFLAPDEAQRFATLHNDAFLRAQVEQYLHDVRSNRQIFDFHSGKEIDTTLFKGRLDLSPTFRELLGEYTDPTEKMLRTIQKIFTSSQAAQFMSNVKELEINGMKAVMDKETWITTHNKLKDQLAAMVTAGDEKAIATLQSQIRELESYVPTPKDLKLGMLKDSRVSRFVADQLQTHQAPFGVFDTGVGRAMASVNNISKIVHAPYNPIVHVRNWITAGVFATIGKADPHSIGQATKAIQEGDDLYREMLREGILGVDFVRGELKKGVDEYFNGSYDAEVTSFLKTAHNTILKWYRQPDVLVRTGTYVAAKARIAKELGKSLDDPAVISRAVEWTDRRTMNYDNMAKIVNAGRQLPLVNLYISYTAEMARILKNLTEDAFHGDVQAMAVLGGLAAGPMIAVKASESMLSEKDQIEWQRAQSQMPAYARSRFKWVQGKDAKGNFKYIDFTPWIITDNFNQMMRAAANGDFASAYATNPVVGWENTPAWNLITQTVTGKNLRNDREFRDFGDRLTAAAEELAPSFTPGIGYEWKRSTPPVLGGKLGVENFKTGRTETVEGLLMRLGLGLNTPTINPGILDRNFAAQVKRNIANERQYLNDVLKSSLPQKDKDRAVGRFKEAVKVIIAEADSLAAVKVE